MGECDDRSEGVEQWNNSPIRAVSWASAPRGLVMDSASLRVIRISFEDGDVVGCRVPGVFDAYPNDLSLLNQTTYSTDDRLLGM